MMEAQPLVDNFRAGITQERSAPGVLRVIAAQAAGWLGMLLAFVGVMGLYLLVENVLPWHLFSMISTPYSDWVVNGLLLIGRGAAAGFFQALVLKRWAPKRGVWVLVSMAGFALVMLSGLLLINRLNPTPPPDYFYQSQPILEPINPQIARLGGWIGAAVGLAAGLLVGLAQSFWLTGGRRRWWIASAIAWMPLLALIAYVWVYVNLIFQQIYFEDRF